MTNNTSEMETVNGFRTLFVTTYRNLKGEQKYAIYCPYYKATIGPSFDNLESLEDYADKKYSDEYV